MGNVCTQLTRHCTFADDFQTLHHIGRNQIQKFEETFGTEIIPFLAKIKKLLELIGHSLVSYKKSFIITFYISFDL